MPPALAPSAPTASLSDLQTAHARAIRLRNLAQREPMVRDLLRTHADELAGAGSKCAALETKLAEIDGRHASLAVEASRLAESNAGLATQLAAKEEELTSLRTQLADAKEKLAAALKPKRAS